MSSFGLFTGLAAGGSCQLMGMSVRLYENPSCMDYKLELVGEYSGKSYFHLISVRDLVAHSPDYIDQIIIHFANKIQHEERKIHYGLLGQANSTSSGHSVNAQSGGGGAGGSFSIAPGAINRASVLHRPASVVGIFGASDAPKEPLKFAGFKLGELTGVRGWQIGSDGFLRSMTANVVWAPGEPMDGKTNSKSEHCGVYAYKKARDFLKAHGDLHIYGKVALWGDVIEHELGYRAEFAKITSLDGVLGSQRDDRELARCRERYGLTSASL